MQVFTIPVAPGDVVIAGTDGLFDNLYNNEITAVVVHATRAGLGPQVTAQKIAALARQRAQDRDRQTPFSTAAQDAGFRYYGGKLDDITVVVSYITGSRDVCSVLFYTSCISRLIVFVCYVPILGMNSMHFLFHIWRLEAIIIDGSSACICRKNNRQLKIVLLIQNIRLSHETDQFWYLFL